MRKEIVVLLLALAVVIVVAANLLQRNSKRSEEKTQDLGVQVADNSLQKIQPDSKSAPQTSLAHQKEPLRNPDEPTEETPEEKYAAYVSQRITELTDLGMENDSNSFNTIISELTNRDPEIRKAAMEAAIQFGSRDAIPFLKQAGLEIEDAAGKAALAKA